MQVKFKKLRPDATIPRRFSEEAAGMDLTAVSVEYDHDFDRHIVTYSTGLAMEIPQGYVGLIFPRSSIKSKNLVLTNCVGVIDADYRGEIKLVFRTITNLAFATYVPGERVAQLVIMALPSFEVIETDELSDTIRGNGGYGSTGK